MRFGIAPLSCMLGLTACLESPDVVATLESDASDLPPDAGLETLPLVGAIDVHDPAIVHAGDQYLLFSTGAGIPTKVSSDLRSFREAGVVFTQNPDWIAEEVPGATDLWSPDVAFFGGVYHLYYAASTFGSSRSCIGHGSSETLGTDITWLDRGPVICSNTTATFDDWNAIDPGVLVRGGEVWLAFGSYLSGIKLIRLDDNGDHDGSELVSIAARPDAVAIQASALAEHGGFAYLFSSFDSCCQGADSTHKIMVGRADDVTGPYLDRSGAALLDGGGTLLLESDDRWRGPGSNDVLVDGNRIYNVYHAYDAANGGRPTLRISSLIWDEAGWPISGGP